MSRPDMILTGPQALVIGAAAALVWTYRVPLARLAHFLYWGELLWPDEDDDYVDFVGANPDLYLGPDGGTP